MVRNTPRGDNPGHPGIKRAKDRERDSTVPEALMAGP
jgi:hypothetical protein